jgi:hypothetical protein
MKGNILVSLDVDLVERVKTQVEPRGFSRLVEQLLSAWYDVEIVNKKKFQHLNIDKLEEEEKQYVAHLTKVKREILEKKQLLKNEKQKQKKERKESISNEHWSNRKGPVIEYENKEDPENEINTE